MRSGNLPDGGNDKVTWKRSRDLIIRRRNNVTLRRDGDVPQRCTDCFIWDLQDTSQRRTNGTSRTRTTETSWWCFIWDLSETSWRRTDTTSLLRPLKTSSRRFNKMLWRRTTETSSRLSTETSLGVSFETYLRRHWDVQRDVLTTSPWRLVPGWDSSKSVWG